MRATHGYIESENVFLSLGVTRSSSFIRRVVRDRYILKGIYPSQSEDNGQDFPMEISCRKRSGENFKTSLLSLLFLFYLKTVHFVNYHGSRTRDRVT